MTVQLQIFICMRLQMHRSRREKKTERKTLNKTIYQIASIRWKKHSKVECWSLGLRREIYGMSEVCSSMLNWIFSGFSLLIIPLEFQWNLTWHIGMRLMHFVASSTDSYSHRKWRKRSTHSRNNDRDLIQLKGILLSFVYIVAAFFRVCLVVCACWLVDSSFFPLHVCINIVPVACMNLIAHFMWMWMCVLMDIGFCFDWCTYFLFHFTFFSMLRLLQWSAHFFLLIIVIPLSVCTPILMMA